MQAVVRGIRIVIVIIIPVAIALQASFGGMNTDQLEQQCAAEMRRRIQPDEKIYSMTFTTSSGSRYGVRPKRAKTTGVVVRVDEGFKVYAAECTPNKTNTGILLSSPSVSFAKK